MNSLYGQAIGKHINEENLKRSENWLVNYNNERVVDYESLPSGEYNNKYKSDPGIDKIVDVEKSMPSNLGISVLSRSKRL